MKAGLRKWVGVLLCVTMLLSICPTAIFAADEKYVFFTQDFESCTDGVLADAKTTGFDGSNAVNDVACMKTVKDEDGNMVIKAYHAAPTAEGEKTRAPRLEKVVYFSGTDEMTISFDAKTSGGTSTLSLLVTSSDGKTSLGAVSIPLKGTDWSHCDVKINIKNATAQLYINDKKSGDKVSLDIEGVIKVGIRFRVHADIDGSVIMFDNVEFSTPNKDYVNLPPVKLDTIPTTKYNEADAKPETGTLIKLVDQDFDGLKAGEAIAAAPKAEFTSSAINEAARMYVEKDTDGNQMLKAYHGEPNAAGATTRTPRVDRIVVLDGVNTLTVDYDVKSNGGRSWLVTNIVHQTENTKFAQLETPSNFTEWTHIKIRMDIKNKKADVYVNGRFLHTKTLKIDGEKNIRVRFQASVETNGDWVAIDNVQITTPDVNAGGIISLDGASINWSKVSVSSENKTGYLEMMRKSHPRIYVTDWQEVRNKVATDPHAQAWAKTVIKHADSMLLTQPTEYYRNVRGNINDCSTSFKKNIVAVAMAYGLTGDARYKDRVYQELETIGNWPDWGSDAFLCTAHILFAYGVCYDWLYNDFTPEQRANIVGWVRDKGFHESILFYEGSPTGTDFTKAQNNWNQVCNGSNIVAAIAFADELPNVSDYILYRAAESLPRSYAEISPNGAYAEPVGYWDYGIRHLVKAMSALDTALMPGNTLPTELDFSLVPGVNNTGDFPIYYNGARETFDYGDGESKLVDTPILFYLANKFNKPLYAWYMNNLWDTNPVVSGANHHDAVLSILWYNPENATLTGSDISLDKYYESREKHGTNGISMRASWEDDNGMIVMMRGGDQTASHAALDAGGFVLDWAGKRWVYMHSRNPVPNIPGGVYSWPSFHKKAEQGGHYDYYHCRGEANNTIIANPKQGVADMNIKYYAAMERHESGKNTAYAILDTTDTNLDYESAKRGMMLTNNRSMVVLQDEITAKMPSEFYWFVNTEAEITISEDGKSALWEWDGDKMLVRMTQGPAEAKFGVMPTQPLPTSPDPEIQPDIPGHKMFIHVENLQTLNLTVEFVPLREGEGVPAPLAVKPLASWSLEGDSERTTSQTLGSVVALKVDNPNAYAKGAKTYVDTANLDIKPIVQNGRTLVPVRFISENIGATVGWDDATQTVSISTGNKDISLQIGSATMMVNGAAVTLDVPAQTIGGRTLIPLRALVEALGKQVFWDDRGLILITDAPVDYDAAKIDAIVDMLDIRVQADGKEIKFFDSEVYNYNVEIAKGAAIPTISVLSDKEAVITQGNPATVSVGGKTYTFNFVENPFDGVLGTGSAGVPKTIVAEVENAGNMPTYQTYLTIQGATSSIEFTEEKYPENGTYDGVISEDTVNRWSANGVGNWICYDLGEVKNLHSMALAGFKAISRSYRYDIEVSTDGVNFTKVSTIETPMLVDHAVFALGNVQARYVRVTGTYSSNSSWIGISEIRFYDSEQMQIDDQNAWNTYFYTTAINALAGTKAKLLVHVYDKAGTELANPLSDITFTCTKPEVATVDANGNVTLLKAGSATIHVECQTLSGVITSSISVTVE